MTRKLTRKLAGVLGVLALLAFAGQTYDVPLVGEAHAAKKTKFCIFHIQGTNNHWVLVTSPGSRETHEAHGDTVVVAYDGAGCRTLADPG